MKSKRNAPLSALKVSLAGLLAALMIVFASASMPLHAQGSSSTAQSSAGQSTADQEDETAVYKQSTPVRVVGRYLHLSPHAASVVFENFNFLLLAGVLVFYAAKLLPAFFRGRQETLDQQLMEARSATEKAKQQLSVVEQRLGGLDKEIAELRQRAESDAAADEQRIKQAMEEERKKIVAAAEQEILALTATARRELKQYGAEIAVSHAVSRLQLTEQDDRVLVGEFTANLNADAGRRRN